MKFIDLCAGIGGMRIAFEAVGAECAYSSEIDSQAAVTYAHNFGALPHGDLTLQANKDTIPNHDILVAGIPCQSFSVIGRQDGFDDARGTILVLSNWPIRGAGPTSALL